MSAADEWDLTVPEDATELMTELRRRGIRPGQRLHIGPGVDEQAGGDRPADSDRPRPPRTLSFTGAIEAESDLSTNTDGYLDGFGR